ncbi:hypothetical protein SAMN05660653_00232 [Desulfonatronum thiosulfatophilum]|uniref:Uncharacterized protein n=1 Tax=Desulfonatronum thiosulfatophilum TaxID=617002 RepID=A0A1G6A8Q4_9BACT|nr:hypothetical protein [Desulfonatronum thiosulfatophilum]SDB04716.1 hypothetical protein SAMN05660653_00232 [Desulfonatronum thiosulfatophilum]
MINPNCLPEIACLVSSPDGDLPVTEDNLRIPLEGCDQGTSYGEYFAFIRQALLRDDCRLLRSLGTFLEVEGEPAIVSVRAEKHGALYHPASLSITWRGGAAAKFALLVAISKRGKQALRHESRVLSILQDKPGTPFLPRPQYAMADETASLLVVPWFSGFHEFHVCGDGSFLLWDHDQGIRRLGQSELEKVFFQVGRILTLCLDPKTGAGIHPWSHAAGDFIVRWEGQDVDVRLTTARDYGPLVETDNLLSSLFAFVLDLALRVRLDREDGVGEWVWMDRNVMESAVRGFSAALGEHGAEGEALTALGRLLPSFSPDELLDGYEPLLDRFSRAELMIILPRLEEHCRELSMALGAVSER